MKTGGILYDSFHDNIEKDKSLFRGGGVECMCFA